MLRPALLLLLLLAAGCTAADRPDSPPVSGAYVSGAGGWHS